MSERDALAKVLWMCADEATDTWARSIADHLLASDWLAERDRRIKAEAWREVATEMWRIFLRLPHTPSPLGDYLQRRIKDLRDRADRIEGER